MSSILVSIIIPVYRAEKYIRTCLQSVLNQTYTNWEAICVDDGSPDNSPKILDEYAQKDGRIRVLHQENGGVCAARNRALDAMQGDFFTFLDSDDFLHPQTLEICVFQAERDNADAVFYTHNKTFRTCTAIRQFLHLPAKKKITFKKYEVVEIESVTTDNIFNYITEYSHRKLPNIDNRFRVKHCYILHTFCRSSKAGHVRFRPDIHFYEDFPWWGEVYLTINVATINNLPLYYYYPSVGSVTFSGKQEQRICSLKKALAAAEAIYENNGTAEQKRIWTEQFVVPFKDKLAKKIAKYGDY